MEWLFQCSCGNTVEAALANAKRGHKKSCGCLRGESHLKDITGQRFGRLTAVKRLKRKDNCGKYLWECLCDCGETITTTVAKLNFGHIKSCGCTRKEFYEKSKLDIKGQKFDRLTAIEPTGENNYRGPIWLFQCACGQKIMTNATLVKSGGIRSCGCLKKEMSRQRILDLQKYNIYAEGTYVNAIASNKIRANNTSGVTGVCWNKRRQKWSAEILFQGKQYWLGNFNDKTDAALARKMAEEKYFKPIVEKYLGKGTKPNSDSESGKEQKDILEGNTSSTATGNSTGKS
jgi:hypothetical protein